MIRLWWRDSDGSYREDKDFIPLNLVWSYRHIITTPVLEPDLPQHLDFCLCMKPWRGGSSWLDFTTEVQPRQVATNRWPTRKPIGKYRAEIVVTAANAKAKPKTLEINFTGKWADDPVEMATRGLRVDVRHESPQPTRRVSADDYLLLPR